MRFAADVDPDERVAPFVIDRALADDVRGVEDQPWCHPSTYGQPLSGAKFSPQPILRNEEIDKRVQLLIAYSQVNLSYWLGSNGPVPRAIEAGGGRRAGRRRHARDQPAHPRRAPARRRSCPVRSRARGRARRFAHRRARSVPGPRRARNHRPWERTAGAGRDDRQGRVGARHRSRGPYRPGVDPADLRRAPHHRNAHRRARGATPVGAGG